ncbi:transporter substrate-binding domain-containing protein [Promicromonospora sp. CA-289599]|uniref:transporter substrate-binding domain-containing protein n=1 Tax=Promicromonospora sp. CA-289599 TaxID=3240014 RepID=UPI003D8F4F14
MATAGRRALIALTCVATLVVASGCGPDPESETHEECASLLGVQGRVVIGMHSDQPGLNFQQTDSTRGGFDYDLAQWLGSYCGLNVVEQNLGTTQREGELQDEDGADIVIGSYSITDERKEDISFAGPYMKTKQGVLVRSDSGIESAADLAGKKVCAARSSTSWSQMNENLAGIVAVQEEGFGVCTQKLLDGTVDAVSTDQLLLYGYAEEYGGLRVLPDEQFGNAELYGIGIDHGDAELCAFLNDAILESLISGWWVRAFENNFPDHLDPADFKPDDGDLTECPDPDAEP